MQERTLGKFAVAVTRRKNHGGVQREEVLVRHGETVPAVVVNRHHVLRFVTVFFLTFVGETVLNGIGAVSRSETIVGDIGVRGVVVQPHGAAVIVLVEAAGIIAYRIAVVNKQFMIRILSSHLESVSVALAWVFLEGDGDGLAVTIHHLRAYFAVKPCLVHA